MPPKFKLTYFGTYGIAEPIRYLLSYGNYDFEEVRLTREQWPQVKCTTPFGTVPVFEFDGKVFAQSIAVCRYLANLMQLVGTDPDENLAIDTIVDTIVDFRTKITRVFYETSEEVKKILAEELKSVHMPFYLSRFDEIAKQNEGYLALCRLTWADIYFLGFSDALKQFAGDDVFDNFPHLLQVIENVATIPSIKEWIDKRPTNFF